MRRASRESAGRAPSGARSKAPGLVPVGFGSPGPWVTALLDCASCLDGDGTVDDNPRRLSQRPARHTRPRGVHAEPRMLLAAHPRHRVFGAVYIHHVVGRSTWYGTSSTMWVKRVRGDHQAGRVTPRRHILDPGFDSYGQIE